MIRNSRFISIFLLFILFSINAFPEIIIDKTFIERADSLFGEKKYDQAITKYREFLNLHRDAKSIEKKTVAECNENIALCFFKLNEYDSAISWFNKNLDIYSDINELESLASTLNNIGLNYKIKGEYDKAIEYYLQAVKIDEDLGNQDEVGKTYNNIGMVYRVWGKYDKAIEYFERSLKVKKLQNDRPGESRTLNNIGLVYTDWKKYDQAIVSFRESIKIEEENGEKADIAIQLNNLGRVYYYRKDYDSALVFFNQALKIHKQNKMQDQVALTYNNIGKVYRGLGNYSEAEQYIESALFIFDTLGMKAEKATSLANLSEIFRKLGNNGYALQLLDSSNAIAEKIDYASQLQQNYRYYSDLYGDQGNYKKALDYYKRYTDLKDTVFNKEILKQLSDFQAKYEKEKDQARILSLEKENLVKTNQRNGYMFSVIGIIIMATFAIIYFRQRAIHVKVIADQKIRQLEEEKKFMAAKLLVEGQEEERKRIATELHDGLGVLLSATRMQFSVIKDKSPDNIELIERASKMLEQATGDVRKISHNMMPGLLTKLGFFEAVEDLFEGLNDTSGVQASCKITGIQERLPENKEIMLYRIVQELVNNTLKHAQAKNIEIRIDMVPGSLHIDYTDDGVGFNLEEKLSVQSIGLKSIQSRVNFLNGDLDIASKPGEGVRYALHIPIQQV